MKKVSVFLEKHWDKKSPLLLGYSGGPDSKALLYTLLDAGIQEKLHLAHVDHGWRKESGGEALALEEEAKKLGLPFFTCRLSLDPKENQELASREKRFSFFRSLFEKTPYQALLLAHQAEDLAETVLKRIFEGAHLPFLGGMEETGKRGEMVIWRPLLTVKKEEIFTFLKSKNLVALIDPTNDDPTYLRARMRKEIFPALSKQFGKEIVSNLNVHSERAFELRAYLEKKTMGCSLSRGPWGLYGSVTSLERIEARYLLQKWAELPRHLLEKTLDEAFSQKANRNISPKVFVDRGNVFFLKEKLPSLGSEPIELSPGKIQWGDWTLDVKTTGETHPCTWRDVWTGTFSVEVPQKGFLAAPNLAPGLGPLWNEKKVPAFFRMHAPIFYGEEGRTYEFLTGKILPKKEPSYYLSFQSTLL